MPGDTRPVRVLSDDGGEDLLLMMIVAGGDQVGDHLVPGLGLQTQLHLLVVEEDEGLGRGDSDHHVVP